jgi:adenylylsulfate kinase
MIRLDNISDENIELVELDMKYLEDMFEYSSDPRLYEYFEFPPQQTIEETKEYLERLIERSNIESANWVFIKTKKDSKIIGTFGVHDIDLMRNSCEISYALSPNYWGKGIFSATMKLALNHLINKLHFYRITAVTAKNNIRSTQALQKYNFIQEAVFIDYYRNLNGDYFDASQYTLLISKNKEKKQSNIMPSNLKSGIKEYNEIEKPLVSKKEKILLNKSKSYVVWFTGISGSGKSTLAKNLEKKLYDLKIHTVLLDGDNLRNDLNSDLGFSKNDRKENVRRAGEVSKLFIDSGVVVLAAFISPIAIDRHRARELIGDSNFIEVFCSCSVDICMERDSKGLYKKVMAGKIKNFTGIQSDYEIPINPHLILRTDINNVEDCLDKLISYLEENSFLKKTT